jgi:2-haloacid dehalogenase
MMARRTFLEGALAPGTKPADVLLFDVFGTVVDWHGSIVAEGVAWSKRTGQRVDWAAFAAAWRAGYEPAMARVRSGEWPWMRIDDLHRRILDGLLPRFGLESWTEAERAHWNFVWRRLRPWPEVGAGLSRLKKPYVIATLSNGNMSLLTNLAKFGSLPWDAVLSAELFRHYKPDPEVYLGAANLLGVAPERAMMVACHRGDLLAARRLGLKTAFVARPREHGPNGKAEVVAAGEVDFIAKDFLDLATQLGA